MRFFQSESYLRFKEWVKEVIKYRIVPLLYPLYYFTFSGNQRRSFKKDNLDKWHASLQKEEKRILIVDDKLPFIESGSGYPRTRKIIGELLEMGYFVTYYAFFPRLAFERMRSTLPPEVEFIISPLISVRGFKRLVNKRMSYYDILLINRPIILNRTFKLLPQLKSMNTDLKVIYDSEAINALRIPGSAQRKKKYLDQECELAQEPDVLWAVSALEQQVFREHLKEGSPIEVVSHWVKAERPASIKDRKGILFVGPMYRKGTENHKAFSFFAGNVLPQLSQMDETLIFHHVGLNYVKKAKSGKIRFHGRLAGLNSIYDQCRVFVAPTSLSSGIPIKLIEAAAAGIPVVATSLLASQVGWKHNEHLLVADTAEEFVSACRQLLTDDHLWCRISANALARVQQDFSKDAFSLAIRQSL